MMDPSKTALVVGLLTLSAFFSASETAFFSLNRLRVEKLSSFGNDAAKRVCKLLKKPVELIATILIGNEMVNIALSSVLTVILMKSFGKKGAFLAVPTGVLIILTFGEITPKTLAVRFSQGYAFFASRIIEVFYLLTYPLRKILLTLAQLILKPFGVSLLATQRKISEQEFLALVEEGFKSGSITKEERDLIFKTLELGERDVKEIMIPKHEVFALNQELPLKEAAELVAQKKFSRVPVYGKDLDDIKGILYARRLVPIVLSKERPLKVKDLMDAPFFVHEFKKLDDLLEEMQRSKKHLAVVVDEYGNTAGIVTLDDILEELVGKIPDDTKANVPDFEVIGDNLYRVNASMSVEEFKELFGIKEETAEEGEVDTVGGLVMSLLDRIPREGDKVVWKNLHITVEKMEGRRIKSLLVEKR